MKDDIAISVKNLSKRYLIGQCEQYKTLREAITGAAKAPLCQIKDRLNYARGDRDQSYIWALKDVSFEVEEGEVIGVIGRNGSGKSTLLKILSRITTPTEGTAELHGRVGSLLEVGTGFHPELTGRENIYLSGSILGMRKQEIDDKFDQIIKFSEIEEFLDTPVKRYSSGMYVRLAFAVAAHLDPEILMVDEVLAVGDAEFQKKCLKKMKDISHGGRTVLFVSHNMGAVTQLCERSLLLEKGRLSMMGSASEIVNAYLGSFSQNGNLDFSNFQGTLKTIIEFKDLIINDNKKPEISVISPSEPITIKVLGACKINLPSFRITFSVYKDGVRLFSLHDVQEAELLPKGDFESIFEIPAFFLRPGEYSIALGGYRDNGSEWLWGTDIAIFKVSEQWKIGYDKDNLGMVNLSSYGTRKAIGVS
jgi:lipopolysaccharide transport system ATP-binding protein